MSQQINRRTVSKGLAWSVPAAAAAWSAPIVASAQQAPPFAASGEVTITDLGLACSTPGNSCNKDYGIVKGYVTRYRVCSTYPVDVRVELSSVTLTVGSTTYYNVPVSPSTITIGANETCKIVDVNIRHNNSSNTSMSASGTFDVYAGDLLIIKDKEYTAYSEETPNCPYPGNGDNCLPGEPGSTVPVAPAALAQPAVEEPVVEEPVVEEPVAEEPVAEEPVAEEASEEVTN